MSYILGISCFYHDSAITIIKNGEIKFAAQEERYTRIKHDSSFPINAIKKSLDYLDINLSDIKSIVFYDKPFLKFERLLETYIATIPISYNSFRMAIPIWLREKLFLKDLLIKSLRKISKGFKGDNLFFTEHHFSHAASAFYPSPFEESAILVIDGVGEWATTSLSVGRKNKIEILKEINFPHSIGLLYSAFTYYLGFKVNSGEYKVMGLAPYGEPKYVKVIFDEIVDLKEDGSFKLNQKYFNYSSGLKMISKKFINLFGRAVRMPDQENLDQFHMDIARSVQEVIETIILKITNHLFYSTKITNLCIAGGVGLNCVANGKILKQGLFKKIWIQPASGDAGGSLGAALGKWYYEDNNNRISNSIDKMQGSYLGDEYNNHEVKNQLDKLGAVYKEFSKESMLENTAIKLSEGSAVGWFQGRMEFGPRSLGSRSIIADPRSKIMQKNLNLKIKFRESFRPFAPSVLFEDVSEYFKLESESPYMLLVDEIKDKYKIENTQSEKLFGIDKLNSIRSKIPAVTHVDYSARIQTVHKETNKVFYDLITKFKKITGYGLLVNTSFNIRGEPIVCSITDAFNCFMGTNLDFLVINEIILSKKEQKINTIKDYKYRYELD